nr:peptidoglycan-binding protein [Planosporangium thailandense]
MPGDLDLRVRQLIVRLRELKDEVGISTATLAGKTAYSKSSWERYLNGRTCPPRHAVEALGKLAGADPARLLALWMLADQARQARPGREPAADTEPAGAADTEPAGGADTEPAGGADTEPAGGADTEPDAGTGEAPPGFRRRFRWRFGRVGVAVVSGVAVLSLLGLGIWVAGPGLSTRRSSVATPSSYHCDYTTRDGRTYAGHSTTSDRLVALNAGGKDVAEVQCLLKRHGFDPGRIDGLYGTHTEQAVKDLQRAGGAVADGMVGPQTWALLRG